MSLFGLHAWRIASDMVRHALATRSLMLVVTALLLAVAIAFSGTLHQLAPVLVYPFV